MVSSMRMGRNVNYRILDIDWCTSDKVVLASDDGCVRVLEMAMKSASYRMDEQDLTGETVNEKELIFKYIILRVECIGLMFCAYVFIDTELICGEYLQIQCGVLTSCYPELLSL